MTDHLITPPTEVVQQWTALANEEEGCKVWSAIATQAARWGSDRELDACCEWLARNYNYPQVDHPLRAARRPKPPSLKEQAFAALQNSHVDPVDETLQLSADAELIIRRALEALDD